MRERPRLVAQQAVDALLGMKRSCQRQTQVLDLPVRRMISTVPTPSAVSSTISARQTCFCGVLRSRTIASRRRRSEAESVEGDAGAHAPDSHAAAGRGIPPGFKCQVLSTRRPAVRAAVPVPPSTTTLPRRLPDFSTTAVFPDVTSRMKRPMSAGVEVADELWSEEGLDVALDPPAVHVEGARPLRPAALAEDQPAPRRLEITVAELLDRERLPARHPILLRILAARHVAEDALRLLARLLDRERPVGADLDPPRAAAGAVLRDIGLPPRRPTRTPKPGRASSHMK